jgi:hypothetical protein
MDRKQKEALIALAEKGKTYREIGKEAKVAPNSIKASLYNYVRIYCILYTVKTAKTHQTLSPIRLYLLFCTYI